MAELGLRETDRENQWQEVQVKAFRAFLNSYLVKKSRRVDSLETDLKDGVNLCQFVDIVENNRAKKFCNWKERPTRKIQMIENLDLAVKHFTNSWGVRLVGIGPEDIHECNMKLILGLLWSLFRKLRLSSIDDGKSTAGATMEEIMLRWVRATLADYKDIDIKDFHSSFNDGRAFSALIHKFNPVFLDYEKVDKASSDEARAQRLEAAFSVAENKMNIPQLLEVKDCVSNDVDERSVLLYVSMYYHAFASEEERRRLEAEMGQMETNLADLKSELKNLQTDLAMMERDVRDVSESAESWAKEMKLRADREAALNAEKNMLAEELAALRRKVEFAEQLRAKEAALYEKTALLRELEAKLLQPGLSEEEKRALREQIEKLRAELGLVEKDVSETRARGEREKLDDTGSEANSRDTLERELHELRQKTAMEATLLAQRQRIAEKRAKMLAMLEKRKGNIQCAEMTWGVLQRQLNEHIEDMNAWMQVENGAGSGRTTVSVLDFVPEHEPFLEQLDTLTERLRQQTVSLSASFKGTASATESSAAEYAQGPATVAGKAVHARALGTSLVLAAKQGAVATASNSRSYSDFADARADGARVVLPPAAAGGADFVVELADAAAAQQWARVLAARVAAAQYIAAKGADAADARVLLYLAMPTVSSLYVDDTPIGAAERTALATVVRLHEASLRAVSFAGADVSSDDVAALLGGRTLPKLEMLRLSRSPVGLSVGALAELIKALPGLRELHLSTCSIDASGLALVLAALEAAGTAKEMRVVVLSTNPIGDTGLASVARTFGGSAALVSLLLSGAGISDAAASSLSTLLTGTAGLRRLDLSRNSLTDAALVAIDAAVSAHPALCALDFSSNNLGSQGVARIYEMVHRSAMLDYINLSQNNVASTPDAVQLLCRDGFQLKDFVLFRAAAFDSLEAAEYGADVDLDDRRVSLGGFVSARQHRAATVLAPRNNSLPNASEQSEKDDEEEVSAEGDEEDSAGAAKKEKAKKGKKTKKEK